MRSVLTAALALLTVAASGCLPSARESPDLAAHLSPGCLAPMEERSTPAGVRFVRTSDACFDGLPDWPFQARHVDLDGLRQGYVDEGPRDGPVVLMLHGQPSWSYLYRFMIADLAGRGYRAVAMDHLGFGLSDKPVGLDAHSFLNHADRLVAFMDTLDLGDDVTLFAQDWGSVVGLYVAGGDLDRFQRIVIGNGGLPVVEAPAGPPEDVVASNRAFHRMLTLVPAEQPPFFDDEGNSVLPGGGGGGADLFGQWATYARTYEGFRPSVMVEALTYRALSDAEEVAYDAPYPHRVAMAGPRTFPGLRDELVGVTAERRAALAAYRRPFLTVFGRNDPGLAGEGDGQPWLTENVPGAQGQPHVRFPDASHFLQDDKGPEIAAIVDAIVRANPAE